MLLRLRIWRRLVTNLAVLDPSVMRAALWTLPATTWPFFRSRRRRLKHRPTKALRSFPTGVELVRFHVPKAYEFHSRPITGWSRLLLIVLIGLP